MHDLSHIMRVQIFDQIFFGLVIALVGNLALFSIKKNGTASALVVPLLIIVAIYRLAVARTFTRPMRNLSFHAAADLDRADQVRRPHMHAGQSG